MSTGQQYRIPPAQRNPQAAENFGRALGTVAYDVTTFSALGRAEQAFRSHMERTGDLKQSLWLGGIAGRRWNFYYMAWVAWLVYIVIAFFALVSAGSEPPVSPQISPDSPLYNQSDSAYDLTFVLGWWLALPICWHSLLILHKRNIDFGLHRRGMWYHLARPLAYLTNWLPNWTLYATFVVVPFGTPLLFI